MVDPFLGEIKLAGYQFAPNGWALAQGQILPISQYTALFSLIGTFYGGNGTSNFALPDLRGRSIAGPNGPNNYVIGETDGTETVTVLLTEYPAHTHTFNVYDTFGLATQPTSAHYLASTRANSPPPPAAGPNLYGAPTSLTPLIPAVLATYGGGNQPHENRQPYLCMNYAIALTGIFPSRQ